MKRLIPNLFYIAVFGLSIAITIIAAAENYSANNGKECVLIVAGERLHFVAQPQAGYVLKKRDDIDSIDTVSRFLKSSDDVKISPICGLGRKGIFVSVGGTKLSNLFQPSITTVKSWFLTLEVKYDGELVFSDTDEKGAINQHPTALKDAFAIGQKLVATNQQS